MSIIVPPIGRQNDQDINPTLQFFYEPPKDQFPFHPFGAGGHPRNTWPHPRATVTNLEGWVRETRAALDKATQGFSSQDAELYRRLSYVSAKDGDPKARAAAGQLRDMLATGIRAVAASNDAPGSLALERMKMELDQVREDAHRYTGTYFRSAPRQ